MVPAVDVTADKPSTTHKFQAEVSELLSLVIHSLYSHKEVFLRELISNASDALDRLRFRATSQPELLSEDTRLEVRISADRALGTVTIEDTGIGMTHDELRENLGTIAHSGSRAFLQAIKDKGGKDGALSLIGQFGVGFYSAYLVSDRVEVTSLAAGATEAFRWSSDAKDAFTLEPAERRERGTQVVLHLKEDQKEFLEEWRLRELITRYSDFVSHPIKLSVTREAKPGEDKDQSKPAEPTLETVNQASALWQRPKSEITDQQYDDLYKHLTRDGSAPLARTHFRVEGAQQFVGLLYLPRLPPFDLNGARRGVRLFVKRIFVMDDCEEILPQWLRFVRGIVDSDDLPLNVSREILQDSTIVRSIRKQVVKKTLDLFDEIARDRPEDYATFWKSFGTVLKEGVHFDWEARERLAPLLRYQSSHGEGLTSLSEYVSRMPAGQEAIYYAFGDSQQVIASSPHSESLRKRGYEVLYMTDPVDEWATESLHEFDKKPLVSVMRADLKLGATEEDKQRKDEQASALEPLLSRFRTVLQDRVREVRLSDRLTDSPCCLVIPEGGHHAYMDRLLRGQGHKLPSPKRLLEINPGHPLMESLTALLSDGAHTEKVKEWIELLYDQALLTEGSTVADPNLLARRMTSLLVQAAADATSRPPLEGARHQE